MNIKPQNKAPAWKAESVPKRLMNCLHELQVYGILSEEEHITFSGRLAVAMQSGKPQVLTPQKT